MESFVGHNPGLPSRIPYTLYFEDFTDVKLHDILKAKLASCRLPGIQIQRDLFTKIAIYRLGKGRGREGFGNA